MGFNLTNGFDKMKTDQLVEILQTKKIQCREPPQGGQISRKKITKDQKSGGLQGEGLLGQDDSLLLIDPL